MNQFPQFPGSLATSHYSGVLSILRGREHVRIDDIVRLEGDLNYTRFVLADGRTILTSKNLSFYQPLLPDTFIRVHKSFLLNRYYILGFGRLYVRMTDGYEVMVARRKRRLVKSLSFGS